MHIAFLASSLLIFARGESSRIHESTDKVGTGYGDQKTSHRRLDSHTDCINAIASFTLIDTGTIPNRLYTIGLDDLSSAIGPFNIRANVVDDICTESASIRLEGGPFPNRCESNLPFTAFGDPSLMDLEDSVANYCNRARNIPPGIYTIKDTPSAGPACSHESKGEELAVSFVIQEPERPTAKPSAHPSKSVSSWSQVGIDIDGENADDNFGGSVALSADGTIVAIGASSNNGSGTGAGHVRVYKRTGTVWNQIFGDDIDGEDVDDASGNAVALTADGNVVAIGALNNNGSGFEAGHVRIYIWNGDMWKQLGLDIDGARSGDTFGWELALSSDGKTVAVGAPFSGSAITGYVQVYNWNGSVWQQLGQSILGENDFDFSGSSVALSGDGMILAIGSPNNDGSGTNNFVGHVRVFKWNGSLWSQVGVDIDGEDIDDVSGSSVSLSANGKIVAIGARDNSGSGTNAGHVRVYRWNGTSWKQIGLDIDGENPGDKSGQQVLLSMDGMTVAIGAIRNDEAGINAGHVRVFKWDGLNWMQVGLDIDGNGPGEFTGASLGLSWCSEGWNWRSSASLQH